MDRCITFAAERLTGDVHMVINGFEPRPFVTRCVRASRSLAHRSWLRFMLPYWQVLGHVSTFIEVCACGHTMECPIFGWIGQGKTLATNKPPDDEYDLLSGKWLV